MKRYVVGFLFSLDKSNVVLIKKNKPIWQKGKLNGVGGKVEAGESPDSAMSREFYEETGVYIKSTAWVLFHQFISIDKEEILFFHTRSSLIGDIKSMEEEKVSVIKVDTLPYNTVNDLDYLIKMALTR